MTTGTVSTGKKRGFFYGYIIVGAAFLVMVVTSGSLYSYGVFVKPLIEEFGWSRALTAGAYSMALIVLGFFFTITGRLNDKFGPRRVLPACALILGGGYALMTQIEAAWQLYLFYGFIVAVGQSGSLIPMMSTVARWFLKRRGLMSGIVVAGVGVGQVIMPPIATQLEASHGWRMTFLVLGLLCLVVLLGVSRLLKRDPSEVGQFPDGALGAAQSAKVAEAGGVSRQKAIRSRQLWIIFGMYICYGFMVQGTMVHLVPHATDLGISAVIAASILSVVGGVSAAGRIGMGVIGDRTGHKKALIAVFILAIVAFVWLQFAHDLPSLMLFAALFGFAYGGLIALESPLVAEVFGLKAHGALLGIVHFGATIGGAASPLLAGRIFDITGRYEIAFIITTAFIIAGLVLATTLRTGEKPANT